MENVNVAELLENCPKGMELYSPIFGKVYLDKIRPHLAIRVTTDKEQSDIKEEFLYDGRYGINGECMLFPSKDKMSWEGFVPPYEFRDGDIVTRTDRGSLVAFIYKERTSVAIVKHHFALYTGSLGTVINGEIWVVESNIRFATEEEKTKLFQAIKDNGLEWNAEKKCLEKLEPQYPKTYKECCYILGLHTMDNDAQGYNRVLIRRLQELIICRDAYLMGFIGSPWYPDYEIDEDGIGTVKFCIKNIGGKIKKIETTVSNTILAFPTAKMRDAFYENFKDSIDRSKELL